VGNWFLMVILVPVCASILSLVIAGLLIRNPSGKLALDQPNDRSLHSKPTLKGVGIAIVITTVSVVSFLLIFYGDTKSFLVTVGFTVVAMGVLGWLDDHQNLAVRVRLFVQLLVSVAAIGILGGISEVNFGGFVFDLWLPVSLILSAMFLIWMTNLYNFMDGADGYVCSQGILTSLIMAYWFFIYGDTTLMLLCLGVGGATAGVVVFNWAPAQVFLGDTGSLALGIIFGLLAIYGITRYNMSASAFLLLYGLFLYDATVTLARRAFMSERLWEAHSTHFYQRLIHAGFSHSKLSVIASGITIYLAILATLDILSAKPRPLWLIVGVISLSLLATITSRYERRSRSES